MNPLDEHRAHRTDRPEGEGRRHGHCGHHGESRGHCGGRHGGRQKHLSSLLEGRPEAMVLFVGAANCARHRADQLAALMRAGRLALLCLTTADYATGRYLHQITDAMVELSGQKGVKEFVVMYGCQWAVLSTDFEMLARELKDGHGITATLDATCHLCGNAQGGEDDHREGRRDGE